MNILFTIATNSHLGHAKSLIESFQRHNDKYISIICLIDNYDNVPDNLKVEDTILICNYKNLNSSDVESMAKRYTPFEFSCAMKPFFAEHLLEKYNPSTLLYLDSDVVVFNSLKLDHLFESSSILLTPHCTEPYDDMESNQLNYGLYNAGFFAIKNNSTALSFLRWWKKNLFKNCIIDLLNGKYVDQIWLNLVPLYFNNVYILDNPGYNVARWNLKQREITENKALYIVNESSDLIFFHYSGYDIAENIFPIDNPNIIKEVNNVVFQKLLKEINSLLSKNNVKNYKSLKASYGYSETVRENKKRYDLSIITRFSNKISHFLKNKR